MKTAVKIASTLPRSVAQSMSTSVVTIIAKTPYVSLDGSHALPKMNSKNPTSWNAGMLAYRI